MQPLWESIIYGRPVPKKNSAILNTRGKRPIILPSKAYKTYRSDFLTQARRPLSPIQIPIWVKAIYVLPDRRWWPDLVGLLQATGDCLEDAGVIEDDKLIRSWDQSRIAELDKDNPRAVITVYPLGEEIPDG